MGSAASKAPKRAFPKTQLPQSLKQGKAAVEQPELRIAAQRAAPEGQEAIDQNAAKDIEQDFLRQLKQEGVKDADLGSFLDRLGGSIAGKQVSTQDVKRATARKVAHQAREQGRLSTADLRQLFHDVHCLEQARSHLDVDDLCMRYKVDRSLLKSVLHFNRIPAITQAADGRLFGSWQLKA